ADDRKPREPDAAGEPRVRHLHVRLDRQAQGRAGGAPAGRPALTATDAWYGFGPADTWTLFHSYAFDFSVGGLWGALLDGGRLVVPPLWTTRSPQALAELLVAEQVTVFNSTPTLFVSVQDELIRVGDELALRYVVFGGEALRPSALRPWFKRFGQD